MRTHQIHRQTPGDVHTTMPISTRHMAQLCTSVVMLDTIIATYPPASVLMPCHKRLNHWVPQCPGFHGFASVHWTLPVPGGISTSLCPVRMYGLVQPSLPRTSGMLLEFKPGHAFGGTCSSPTGGGQKGGDQAEVTRWSPHPVPRAWLETFILSQAGIGKDKVAASMGVPADTDVSPVSF